LWRVARFSDLSRFIANGRLACTIDKVSGVITTTKTSAENKTVAYEQVVKQGDILLNGTPSAARRPTATSRLTKRINGP
jgi:hypothetical protein